MWGRKGHHFQQCGHLGKDLKGGEGVNHAVTRQRKQQVHRPRGRSMPGVFLEKRSVRLAVG